MSDEAGFGVEAQLGPAWLHETRVSALQFPEYRAIWVSVIVPGVVRMCTADGLGVAGEVKLYHAVFRVPPVQHEGFPGSDAEPVHELFPLALTSKSRYCALHGRSLAGAKPKRCGVLSC